MVANESAAKVSTTDARKTCSHTFCCLIVAAKLEQENAGEKQDDTGKKMEREFLQLKNNLVNSKEPVSLQRRRI